jgi:hypothetical protein
MFDLLSTETLLIYLFILTLGFIVYVYIVRAIFSIPKQIRLQRAQLKMMALIAEQLKADPQVIKEIAEEGDYSLKDDAHFSTVEELKKATA